MGVTLSGSQGLSSPQANGYVFSMDLTLSGPRLDADCLIADSTHMKVAFGVGFKMIVVPSSVPTGKVKVPTGRVKVPAGRYVVPTGKDKFIVSAGKTKVIPAGSTILVCVVYVYSGLIVKIRWFLALGWHLEEIHVTWAHLEKKRTRLRLYTKYLEEPRIQSVETACQYKAMASYLHGYGVCRQKGYAVLGIGKYVAHPTPEVVKKELSKIAINESYLDKTLVHKSSFSVAWRILFTFVIQVLGGNYFSTEQVNSIQQLLAYYLITGTEKDSMFPLPFSGKKKKLKSQTVTPTLPKSQGPEASESLPQKRKKPLSKKAPKETKATPPPQTNGGLPSTLDEGTRKSQSLSEGTTTDPERPRGQMTQRETYTTTLMMNLINPTITDPSGTGAEYQVDKTQSTRLRYQTLTENKGKTSSKVDPGLQTLQFTTFADISSKYLLSEIELNQESDEEEVFAAGDDMEEETQADEEEHQSPSPNKDKPEPSHTPTTQESDSTTDQ
ncbi:hypothetical protein Tco_1174314 [Tanacetum coccineum]